MFMDLADGNTYNFELTITHELWQDQEEHGTCTKSKQAQLQQILQLPQL
jgi:hypothetical protein